MKALTVHYHKWILIQLIFVGLIVTSVSFGQCNTIFVTTNGTGTGATIYNPSSIENAFLIAAPGDKIMIATGTYQIDNPLDDVMLLESS